MANRVLIFYPLPATQLSFKTGFNAARLRINFDFLSLVSRITLCLRKAKQERGNRSEGLASRAGWYFSGMPIHDFRTEEVDVVRPMQSSAHIAQNTAIPKGYTMNQSTAVYQRSDAGRKEIINRRHALAQSERLALILVDGVSPANEVRAKLKALTDERFEQAISRLRSLGLVDEVQQASGDPTLEQVAEEIAQLLQRQDRLDPVTVVCSDPNHHFCPAAIEKACELPGHGSTALPDLALQEWTPRAGWHVSQAANASQNALPSSVMSSYRMQRRQVRRVRGSGIGPTGQYDGLEQHVTGTPAISLGILLGVTVILTGTLMIAP